MHYAEREIDDTARHPKKTLHLFKDDIELCALRRLRTLTSDGTALEPLHSKALFKANRLKKVNALLQHLALPLSPVPPTPKHRS